MFSTFQILIIQFHLIGLAESCYLSNVYGPTTAKDKPLFLHCIVNTHNLLSPSQQIFGGDFNLVNSLDKKQSRIQRLDVDSILFQETITTSNLIDIKTVNGTFTWNNRGGGVQQVASKLDRFIISEDIVRWDIFLEASILPSHGSNHCPICLLIPKILTP